MKLSITVPAYKAKFLYEAIDSVLKQTYNDFELIIVDDCSPEDLKSIVDKFSDPRIRYYRNKKNCGAVDVVDNWNICLSYCTGEYVICMGDDDRLLPCCLEEYVKLIGKYPGLEVYHAWTEIIDEKGNTLSLQEPRPEYEGGLSMIINRWSGRLQYIGDFCFKAKALKDYGGYYKLPFAWASDDISAARAALKGGVANMQVLGFQYRNSPATISNNKNYEIKLEAALAERDWYRHLYLSILKESLDYIEGIYFSQMDKGLEINFRTKRKVYLVDEFSSHPLKFFSYIKRYKNLELSFLRLLYYLFCGLYKKCSLIMTKEK